MRLKTANAINKITHKRLFTTQNTDNRQLQIIIILFIKRVYRSSIKH